MYLKKLIALICLLYAFNLSAQKSKVDSISKVLKGKLTIPERAIAMKDLAKAYENVEQKKAVTLYDQALSFAKKNKLDYETAVIYQNKSFVYSAMAQSQKAIKVLDSALTFAAKSNHAKKEEMIANTYNTLAANYRNANNYKNAVYYQLKAVRIYERFADYPALVNAYYNLSLYYKEMIDYKKQLESSLKAVEFANKSGKKEAVFVSYIAVAQSYVYLKDIEKASAARDNALKNYDPNYTHNRLTGYHLISGLINLNLGEFKKAQNDFSNSLRIAEEHKQLSTILQSKMQLSRVLAMQKKFEQAEQILKSLEADVEKTQAINQRLILLEYYARLYKEWGKFDKALEYNVKNTALGDSVISLEHKNYIATLEKKYETEKKDNQIKLQQAAIKQKNTLNYILVGSAAALILVLVLGYRNYQHRQKIQQQRISELETEKQLAATEAVLKGEEQERSRLAKDLHDGLGGMLSGIKYSFQHMKGNMILTPDNAQAFERSMEMLDSSIKEMRRVAHNMMPEALMKFGLDAALNDFCNDINQSGALKVNYQSIGLKNEKLENTTAITIYRIAQELINNVIKHADAAQALLQVTKNGDVLSLTVEDDGKGFDKNLLLQAKGMGWSNIANRVEFLKGKLDVQTEPNNGTSILIELNL